jgi:Effector Associated Constant Component 1
VEVRLSVTGLDPVEGLEDLADWLRHEPELRGRVRPAPSSPVEGELGALATVLIAAVGSGGAASVLAGSLKAYLAQPRRAKVRIKVERPDGRHVEIDAEHIKDVEGLVSLVLRDEPKSEA